MSIRMQRANERGKSVEDWLLSWHSFSFNDYYDPANMGFHKLRVFNDDTIAAGKGFGMHPHSNMEIVTIVTEGVLLHKDSTGASGKVVPGMVQVMSAGTGITHSEVNGSKNKALKLFQVWVQTDRPGHKPRYGEQAVDWGKNELNLIVSRNSGAVSINQDAKLFLGVFDSKKKLTINAEPAKGHFLFVVEGSASVEKETLSAGDAALIDDLKGYTAEFSPGTRIILIEC